MNLSTLLCCNGLKKHNTLHIAVAVRQKSCLRGVPPWFLLKQYLQICHSYTKCGCYTLQYMSTFTYRHCSCTVSNPCTTLPLWSFGYICWFTAQREYSIDLLSCLTFYSSDWNDGLLTDCLACCNFLKAGIRNVTSTTVLFLFLCSTETKRDFGLWIYIYIFWFHALIR